MKITLIQNAPRLNRSNLENVLAIVNASALSSDLIVFPELALNGYLLQDKVFEDAWRLDELECLAEASLQCDIIIGAAIKDKSETFNTALYFSKGSLLHQHNKVHLPNYGMFEEARYFFKGKSINSFESRFGKAAMLVCEDVWRAETLSDLSRQKPDVIYVIAASPARDFCDSGMLIEKQWNALLTSMALLSSAHVIFVNRVGFEDGLGFWGGSRYITPNGEVKFQLEHFEEQVLQIKLDPSDHALQKWLAKID